MNSEQVALIFNSYDRGLATRRFLIRDLFDVGKAHTNSAAAARAASAASKITVVDADAVAAAKGREAISQTKLAQAMAQEAIVKKDIAARGTVAQRVAAAETAQNERLAASLRSLSVARTQERNAQRAKLVADRQLTLANALQDPKYVARQYRRVDATTTIAAERLNIAKAVRAEVAANASTMSISAGGGVAFADPKERIAYGRANVGVLAAEKALRDAKQARLDLDTKVLASSHFIDIAEKNQASAADNLARATTRVTETSTEYLSVDKARLTQIQLTTAAQLEQEKMNFRLASSNLKVAESEERVRLAQLATTKASQGKLIQDPNYVAPAASMVGTVAKITGGVAGIAAALIALDASKKALAFNAAEAQIASQTGQTSTDPVKRAKLYRNVQSAAAASLDFAQSQQSQYDPTTLLQGALLPITKGLNPQAVKDILPYLAKQSAVIKSPDLTLAGESLLAMAGYQHGGNLGKTTTPQLKKFIDQALAAEQRTPAPPAALTSSLNTLFSSFQQTGLSTADILGAETQLIRSTGVAPSRAASWLGQLARSSILRPTAGALKLAKGLNVDMGARGLAEAGGNPFVYWSNLYQSLGGDNNLMYRAMMQKGDPHFTTTELASNLISGGGGGSGINALRAFLGLNKSGAMAGAAALSDTYSKAGGTTTAAYDELMRGQQQQMTAAANRFNADLIKAGKRINDVMIPKLLELATEAANAAEALARFVKGLRDSPLSQPILAPVDEKGRIVPTALGANVPLPQSMSMGLIVSSLFNRLLGGGNQPQTAAMGLPHRLAVDDLLKRQADIPDKTVYVPPFSNSYFTGREYTNRGFVTPVSTGRASASNIYQTTAQRFHQSQLIDAYSAAPAAVDLYRKKLTEFNTAIMNGANNHTLEKMRDNLLKMLQTPAVMLGLGDTKVGKDQGVITHAVANIELSRNPKVEDFLASWIKFSQAVKDNQTTAQLKKLADHIRNLMKDPVVAAGLTIGKKSTRDATNLFLRDSGVIAHDLKASGNKDLDTAAQVQLNAANLFYAGVKLHHGSLTALNTGAYKVYNAAVDAAKAANKVHPDKGVYDNSILAAQQQLQSDLIGNLSGVMTEAQARFSLAQATGKDVSGSNAAVKKIIDQQYPYSDQTYTRKLAQYQQDQAALVPTQNETAARLQLAQATGKDLTGALNASRDVLKQQYAGRTDSYAYKLALYQLNQQNTPPVLPGPKLIRPNVAGLGALDAQFTGSVSRLSNPRNMGETRQVQLLEAALRRDEQIIAELRAGTRENAKTAAATQSIDAKTPGKGANKGSRTGQAVSFSTVRAPVS